MSFRELLWTVVSKLLGNHDMENTVNHTKPLESLHPFENQIFEAVINALNQYAKSEEHSRGTTKRKSGRRKKKRSEEEHGSRNQWDRHPDPTPQADPYEDAEQQEYHGETRGQSYPGTKKRTYQFTSR